MSDDRQLVFNLQEKDSPYNLDWLRVARNTKTWVYNTRKLLPPPDFIKDIMRYDSENGYIYWRERKDMPLWWNTRFANQKVSTNGANAVGILYNGERCHVLYHRLAWCCYYEKWPEDKLVIDHLNGDHYDNRIKNLRQVTVSENNKNKSIPKNNKSGHIGVRYQNNLWYAEIKDNNKTIHLGSFKKKEDAIKTRKEAEKKYGYYANHGRAKVGLRKEN